MKLLLEREEVSPDRPDNHGRTPLSWAAEYRHKEAVRRLLEREDVNPNRPDNRGRTPLWWAARPPNNEAVSKLLGKDIKIMY